MTRPKPKRKLTKKQVYDKYTAILDKLDRFDELTYGEIIQLKNDIELCMDNDKEIAELESARIIVQTVNAGVKLEFSLRKLIEKFIKVARVRATAQEEIPDKVLCIRCNKRERHFDDYCKRCADELGTRPKGKV